MSSPSAAPELAHHWTGTSSPPLLLSDVDTTVLDGWTSMDQVAEDWAGLGNRVEVALVSSRTVDEVLYLLARLGARADVIAENGACTAVHSPAVARALGATETFVRNGRRWYLAIPGAPAAEVLEAMCRARDQHGAPVRLAAELPRRRRSELLGRNRHGARLALTRRCSVLIEPPPAEPATLAWLETLRSAGYHAAEGGCWLSIWRGPDRGEAALAYLAARSTAGLLPTTVAAVASSGNDVSLLRTVSRRFVARGPTGEYDPALLALPGIVRLSASGHGGWRRAAALLGTEAPPQPGEAS